MEYLQLAEKIPEKESPIYRADSLYKDPAMNEKFLYLKANVCDINPALVKKCITGTEQDYIMLMKKAREYIRGHFPENEERLLLMLRECIFGYYILSPLLFDKHVSDIKVLSHDRITVKADGQRYLSDAAFFDRADYKAWYERLLRIHRLSFKEEGLLHCTDRKATKDFYLRIDFQLPLLTSDETENIHIRKIPTKKRSWDYLTENGMLDESMAGYIKDRIMAGYGFLISGRGGSGKSTLLNSMLDEISFRESVLVVQESDELYTDIHPQMQFEHTLDDLSERHGYSLEDELRMGLLQDIDNFVIGEIKGGEALYVFTTAMSTGARFFGTIHANDAASSVKRLAHCARYISDYPVCVLEEMLTAVPFVLIHLSRFSIDEILEVEGFDERGGHLCFKTMYRKETG